MTANERSTVVGIFPTRPQAESAINELHRLGFTEQQIGYVVRDAQGHAQGNVTPDETRTAHGAIGGAVSGGVLGGIIGAASSLLIPGFGPAIAGGILAATLGGAAIGAAAGSLIGALTQMGVPEEEARYYQNEFEAGRILVTVYAPGHQREVVDILRRNGAYDAGTQQGPQDSVGTPSYAQVGTAASSADTHNQPGVYNQPTTSHHNPSRPANGNTPYDANNPNGHQYNPAVPNNPNNPSTY